MRWAIPYSINKGHIQQSGVWSCSLSGSLCSFESWQFFYHSSWWQAAHEKKSPLLCKKLVDCQQQDEVCKPLVESLSGQLLCCLLSSLSA